MARIEQLRLAGSNRTLLLLALIAGLVAAVLVFVAVNNGSDDDTATSAPGSVGVAVVVANQDIAVGTEITADMVKVIDVPAGLFVKNAITESSLAIGQTARFPISQGEQIVRASFGVQADEDGLAYVIPRGKRAMALSVEEVTAVGGLLLPGDRVDVIAVFDSDTGTTAVTILQDVEILAIAQEAQGPLPALEDGTDASGQARTSGQLPDNPDTDPGASTVTLALDPQQVATLAAVQQEASRVFLSLRAIGDDVVVGDGARFDVSTLIGP
ncbi:MAG: Flp pilus assembly protein CpaB [Dehalococcoidia bacterium]